jgi:hypothetical protein
MTHHMVQQEFVSKANHKLILSDDELPGLLEKMTEYKAPPAESWLERHQL